MKVFDFKTSENSKMFILETIFKGFVKSLIVMSDQLRAEALAGISSSEFCRDLL